MEKSSYISNNVLFSVIVPIYNVERWLERCVDSIINQGYDDYELILVDDGSTDKCPAICDYYDKQHHYIKVIHKENGGLVSAREAGLLKANGQYVVYVDGDDFVTKDHLFSLGNVVKKYPDLDMVFFGYKISSKDDLYGKKSLKYFSLWEGEYNKEQLIKKVYPFMIYSYKRVNNFSLSCFVWSPWACAIKKDLLLNHYCTDYEIVVGEDVAFTPECLYYSNKVYFLKKCLYFYNVYNEQSIVHEMSGCCPPRLFNYVIDRFEDDKHINKQWVCLYLTMIESYFFIDMIKKGYKDDKIIEILIDDPNKMLTWLSNVQINKLMHPNLIILYICLRFKMYKFYLRLLRKIMKSRG